MQSMSDNVVTLFHGSKNGFDGSPRPDYKFANESTDFGKALYLGVDPIQAFSVNFDKKGYSLVCYRLELELSDLSICTLSGMQWLMFICFNRGVLRDYIKTNLYQSMLKIRKSYDIIVGAIADDTMEYALPDFVDSRCTDIVLFRTLMAYGFQNQYALITYKATNRLMYEVIPNDEIDFNIVQAAKEDYLLKRKYYYNMYCKMFSGVGNTIESLKRKGIFDGVFEDLDTRFIL